ncbi:MAG TPA: LCP family protein [Clostridia bacterium]|nr:LCP family protein [Clostridia bacterium]
MKRTGLLFSICAALLIALFANGLYFLLLSRTVRQRPAPVPISDISEPFPLDPDIPGLWPYELEITGQYMQEEHTNYIESGASGEGRYEGNEPVNLMVLGLDGDKTRCDVILLVQYDPSASKINLLSVARDTRVAVSGSYCKINAVYSKGGERLVARKLSQLTGLPVHYYITMDFEGFREIIDAFGGVEFYVPFRMNYDDPAQKLHIHLDKGLQLLTGRKAEQLVRYRKGNLKGQGYTEGDIGRIRMQQDFLNAFIDQKLKLRYISRFDELFYILGRHMKTNITAGDISYYIADISKIRAGEAEASVLPGDSRIIDGVWYYICDRKKTRDLIRERFVF